MTYLALARQEDEFTRRDREFIRNSCRLTEDECLETSSTKGLVGHLTEFMESKLYKAIVVAFVVLDAIFTGWEVQSMAVRPEYDGNSTFIASVEMMFLVVFTLDMAIRFIVQRLSFFTSADKAWNCMDLIIVLAMLMDGVVSRAEESSGVAGTASNVRVMRILRMVRIVRVIRVLKFFSELRTLLTCILNCFWSLSWTLLVLLLMLYLFGLCLTQGCTDFFLLEPDLRYEPEYARLLERFGTLDVSVLSLFEAVADGVSWGELVETLSPLPWSYTVIFLVYIFVSIFAVLNIVTGVFVNGALTRAQADRESVTQQAMHSRETYLRDMQMVFNEMDTSGSGLIDRHTFQVALRDERTRAFLDAHGLAWQDVNLLFNLIDREGSGTIDCAEFMCGCLKFRGTARSLELAIVHFQLKWVMKTQGMLSHALSKCSTLRDGFATWRPTMPEAMTSVCSETLRGLEAVYMGGTPTANALSRCRQ